MRINIHILKSAFALFLVFDILLTLTSCSVHDSEPQVYFTTGMKIGEVSSHSMICWTRLCKSPKAVPVKHARKERPFRSPLEFDENMPANQMEGAVEGSAGFIKLTLSAASDTIVIPWKKVSENTDFTFCENITGLKENTSYQILVEGRYDEQSPIAQLTGTFKTAPDPDHMAEVNFTSTSCQYYWDHDDSIRGFKTYDSMLKLKPDFHCQTGDFVYYDKPGPIAINTELARHKWHAMNSWPSLVDFYRQVPLYIQKDDHDMLKDDASPLKEPLGEFTFHDGLKVWYEQVPVKGKPYRTVRWGKDLQIWLVEGREYRSENISPDGTDKSIWGKEQKKWFVETMEASDATFKVLLSPTPVVGPDRTKGKNDNHANKAYQTEGDWLRNFLAQQTNAFVVNGDRHWQYVSKDLKTGLMEFSQGPTSDEHAQGWKPNDYRPEHHFLRVNGGFLHVNVYRQDDVPTIKFTHYDVDGNEVHQETIKAVAYELSSQL
jgi:alkaline phosphatase D